MQSRQGLFAAGGLALALVVSACGSSSETTTTPATTAAPGTTAAVTGTTGAGGNKTSSLSSDALKKLQTSLNAVGCDAGAVDGIDGGETEAAIKSFQKASGLTVDGLVGPQTETALSQAVASGKQVCTSTSTTAQATSTTAGNASTTTAGNVTTSTSSSGACPGPECTTFTISPSSGPAGTTITVSSVSGACTYLGQIGLNPTSPPGPSIATGTLTAEGASQYRGTITVPAGTAAGSYVVQAWSTGAMQSAGICQAAFSVT
ncbi:MAG: peptidoglycan-binding protein [Actinobacteria bacterium]|nr:peptidoglycan-binding protein [Actinomycetota bacterium]